MKTKVAKLALITSLIAIPLSALAETVTVTVKGMVCSFCAQGIKKTFGKLPDVQRIDVDLDNKLVTLSLKEGNALSDKEIESTIKDAGYDVLKIERAKDA